MSKSEKRKRRSDELRRKSCAIWQTGDETEDTGAEKRMRAGSVDQQKNQLGNLLVDLLMLQAVYEEHGMQAGTGTHMWVYLFWWGSREATMNIGRLTDRADGRNQRNSIWRLLKVLRQREREGYLTREEFIRAWGGENDWEARYEKARREQRPGGWWGWLDGEKGKELDRVFTEEFGEEARCIRREWIAEAEEILNAPEINEIRARRNNEVAHIDRKAFERDELDSYALGLGKLEEAWTKIVVATDRVVELSFLNKPEQVIAVSQYNHAEMWFGPSVEERIAQTMGETEQRYIEAWEQTLEADRAERRTLYKQRRANG